MVKRTCLCCGKGYEYCPNCGKYFGTAMSAGFDTDVCKEIFNVVSGYNIGVSTLNDVKTVLDKYGIEDVNVYKGVIKDVLMKAKKPMDVEFKEKKATKKPRSLGDVQ